MLAIQKPNETTENRRTYPTISRDGPDFVLLETGERELSSQQERILAKAPVATIEALGIAAVEALTVLDQCTDEKSYKHNSLED